MKTHNFPKCSACVYHQTRKIVGQVYHYCVNPRQADGVRARILKNESSTSKELGYKTSPLWCPRRK